jgi:hypothetical protein
MDNAEQSKQRKPYKAPVAVRVIIDPVKEMLTACEQSPGKLTGDLQCAGVGS